MPPRPSPSSTTPAPSAAPATAPAEQRSGVGVVGRERLLARLVEARRLRCIVVTGPAGSGKSTLVAAWRQAIVPLGFDVAWFTATAQGSAPAAFIDGLLASVARVDPALVQEAVQLGGASVDAQEDADAFERLAISLIRGIAAHPRDLALVIDDLHHLQQPAIHEALQWLLDYAPPNLHLVLVSRGGQALSLDRLRSQSQTLELDRRDLRFTPAETGQFLKAQLGDVDARTIKALHELSDGWVAGLRIFTVDWKKKQLEAGRPAQGEPFARVPARDAQAFTQFFEGEVLSRLSSGELDILVRLAPCRRFCASLCAALVDAPEATARMTALLARLERDDMFVDAVENQTLETWYRLHPLLRETLLARFAALDEATRQAVHGRAFVWFREAGLFEDAVRHAVRSGQPAQAAALVDQCAQSLIVRGERSELIGLLRQLPPRQLNQSLKMRLLAARVQLFERELQACAKTLDGLAPDVPADDSSNRFMLTTLRAALAVQGDDIDAALAMLPQLLDIPPDAEALTIGARNNILSWLYTQQGDYEKARRVQLDTPPLMVDGAPLLATAAGSLHGRNLVGLSYALEGKMTQAERIFRAVAAEAQLGGKACADAYYLAISLLSDVLYELNDARQARALLEGKIDMLERIAIPDALLRVYRVLAAANWQAGNQAEAFAQVERLEAYAVQHQLDRLLAHSLGDQVHLRLLTGELMAAEALLARLDAVHAKHAATTLQMPWEISEVTQRAHIRLAMALGDLDGAAAQLASLVAQCEARGRQRSVAHLLVKSAAVDAQLGRNASARHKLIDALQRGHRLGLLRSLLDADAKARHMMGELAKSEALDPVLAFYVERLLAARTPREAPPAAANAGAGARGAMPAELKAFSEREIEMLRLLAQAMPNKKIARALGLSPETVKWYLSRIYGKLRVSGRDEAVARVRDFGWDMDEARGGEPSAP
ncbi:LuxR C-terminal-related transcriptional regulator [Variovorax sp. J22R133]|uniref:LuxR C-terminal-related transcriptional regulator n=1 Tax=Variovorax brevis TaxID=3053503 RepID=UPI002575FA09|nr:LuxR C-terminal-related transcriptional regulator [Variovorax sp. J22R133]MDM0114031.1 LuxR C-terminal-related transcriptional regulator [Variovorax sp. J22R133]